MGHGREGVRISSGERHESVAARVRYYCFLEVDARAGAHGDLAFASVSGPWMTPTHSSLAYGLTLK